LHKQRGSLRIADRHHIGRAHVAFFKNLDRRNAAASWLTFGSIGSEIHRLGFGQKVGEEALIGLAELAEVVPPAGNIGADVKHDDTLVEWVAGSVLFDRAHDAADELNEWAKVGEYAANHSDGKVLMIEAFAEHASLHDRVKLVVFELLENALVGLSLARVDVSGAKAARAECL
jgi:hypothetical protein